MSRSRVAKYRRQVSEDPDIDNLLSTLSPEEMEQLEKELDAGDPDAGVSAGLNRDQTERASCQREENKRLAQKQASVDLGKTQEKLKEKKSEEKGAEPTQQDSRSNKGSQDVKKLKSQSIGKRVEDKKETQATEKKEKQVEDKISKSKVAEKLEKAESKKSVGDTNTKQTTKEKDKIKEAKEKEKAKEKSENKVEKNEEQLEKKPISNNNLEIKEKKEVTSSNKNVSLEEGKKNLTKDADQGSGTSENGAQNQAEISKEEESSSIFDELLEKVKNNDSEIIELNLNNSDCITIETLMSFTEALEFNTVVKIFSLANTRADDHIALVIAAMLKSNKTITSINLDSNHVTGKGILAIFRALQHNNTLTELRFHNQRHICGGKTEMEIAKILKENTTLLKLGYHFELAGPRMTVTNLLSRNMDKQRQRRLAEQKMSQSLADNNKKGTLEVPKIVPPKKVSPKPSPQPSPKIVQKNTSKKGDVPAPPPPPPPFAPLAPPLFNENIRNSLSPASQRRIVEKTVPPEKNSRDQLLESIRSNNIKKLKKVEVPKWLK
uniref:Leiomodin-1 n=1 Tax=Leptobrachium leishanense TaxID=445787 RepID=A0A8C5LXB1_9ANUR